MNYANMELDIDTHKCAVTYIFPTHTKKADVPYNALFNIEEYEIDIYLSS